MAPAEKYALEGDDERAPPSKLMRNPRAWLAVVQIMLHKLCCWWTLEKPVDWRSVRVVCLGLDGARAWLRLPGRAMGTSSARSACPPRRDTPYGASAPSRARSCRALARDSRAIVSAASGAGKSSVTSCVEGKPSIEHEPTSGFNCRNARVRPHWLLDLWDLGGSALIRKYWQRYLTADTRIVLFVVDAADRARFEEARAALDIATSALPAASVLVLANKQDVPGAATAAELAAALGFDARSGSPPRCAVLPISCARAQREVDSATDVSGIGNALDWIAYELEQQERS
jgi:signal recognition particle receptor subunit beta